MVKSNTTTQNLGYHLSQFDLKIKNGARQIGAIDMAEFNSGAISCNDVNDQAPKFVAFFTCLQIVIEVQDAKQAAKLTKQQSQASMLPVKP